MSDLCRACGLCCDGTLFSGAPLDPDEVEPARRRGLRVLHTEFLQPCSALRGCECTIYEERPRACRRFTCHLLARGGPLAPRVAAVRRTHELLAILRASGLAPAHFEGEVDVDVELATAHTELMRRLGEDFARA